MGTGNHRDGEHTARSWQSMIDWVTETCRVPWEVQAMSRNQRHVIALRRALGQKLREKAGPPPSSAGI